eukprot:9557909-Karenia_brevis.AAC.1
MTPTRSLDGLSDTELLRCVMGTVQELKSDMKMFRQCMAQEDFTDSGPSKVPSQVPGPRSIMPIS